jgi:hypothetical protein
MARLPAIPSTGVVMTLVALAVLLLAPPGAAAQDPTAELAERYAPIVVVRDQPQACGPGEPYLPAPVESVLGRTDVVLRGPAGETVPAPASADLAGRGDGWYLDLPGNPLAPECDYEQWSDAISPQLPPTVYGRVATDPDHPGTLALQYWFWWVFNDWNDRHEGDWEMVQLLFDADSVEQALQGSPTAVAYAQHEGSETSPWDDPKLLRVDDHVVVYPAQGSHAAYFTQSQWFGKSAAAGFGCDDTSALGVEVRPEVVLLPDEPGPGFEWLEFTGRWGEKAPSFNNGPTGPNTKDQWAAPVTWQLEEGRDSAVALPVIGGPAVDSFCSLTQAGSLLFIAVLDQPVLIVGLILAFLVLVVLLVRGTRWRHGGDTAPDRERRAGQVVSASFGLLFRQLPRLWPIVLVLGLSTAGALGLQRLVLHRRPTDDLTDVYAVAQSPALIILAIAITWLVAPIVAAAQAATTRVVEGVAREHYISGWAALAWAVRRPSAAIAQVLLLVAVTALASSLLLLPLALAVIALFAVVMPAAMIEDRGVLDSFRRSRALTKGRRWRAVFLSTLLVWMGASLPPAIGGILLLVTGWPFWLTNTLAIAAGAVLLPFAAIGLTLQFYDFRQESERDQNSRDSVSSTPRSAS